MSLLEVDPDKRLGSKGVEEIKSHEYFEGINWEKLYNKEITPPYVPKVKDDSDLSLIDQYFLEMATPKELKIKKREETYYLEKYEHVNKPAIDRVKKR